MFVHKAVLTLLSHNEYFFVKQDYPSNCPICKKEAPQLQVGLQGKVGCAICVDPESKALAGYYEIYHTEKDPKNKREVRIRRI